MIDYKLLEAMAMVIKEGGFEKAAKKLYISQSAISQRIRLLEEDAGQILISRTFPPSATEAGEKYLKHYMMVAQLEEELNYDLVANNESYSSLPVGINEDSLAMWFLPVMSDFLKENNILLDLRVDDQEETHKMLKSGSVAGCISSKNISVQGCGKFFLGSMNYRLAATPEFKNRFFQHGISADVLKYAPAVIFNIKDNLHTKFLNTFLGKNINKLPCHYVPSTEQFAEFIFEGLGYGLLPDLQGLDSYERGILVDLAPEAHQKVDLYWHCWNIKTELIEKFTSALTGKAGAFLK